METKKERAKRKKAQTIKNNLLKKQKRLSLKKISDKKEEEIIIEKTSFIDESPFGYSISLSRFISKLK